LHMLMSCAQERVIHCEVHGILAKIKILIIKEKNH
jgi:hypothetical protein